jgi:hypothetical protein
MNRRRRTRSGGVQQQITVVDQMAAQPHIPYAILPKRFEPKQVHNNGLQQQSRSSNHETNGNGGGGGGGQGRRRRSAAAPRRGQRQQEYYDDQWEDEEEDLWLEPMPNMMHRRFNRRANRNVAPMSGYYGPRGMVNERGSISYRESNVRCPFVFSSNIWMTTTIRTLTDPWPDQVKDHFDRVVV